MIPRVVHFVHFDVGHGGAPEARSQIPLLESWGYDVRWWGEEDLKLFRLGTTIRGLVQQSIWSASDLMRYEILAKHGGLYFDTDFMFFKRFPDWIHECEALGYWEQEIRKSGMITNAFLGCRPGNRFFRHLVGHFMKNPPSARSHKAAVEQTATHFLTRMLIEFEYRNFTILPSHFFQPLFEKSKYSGSGPVYAQHLVRSRFPGQRRAAS